MKLLNYNPASSAVKFLRQFMQEVKVATLSTMDNDEVSSTRSACCEIDDNCNIWIITERNLPEANETQGTLLYFHTLKNTYLYIDGIIEEISNKNGSIDTLKRKQWFSRKRDLRSGLMLARMIIKKAAYWDNVTAKMIPCYPEYIQYSY